MSVVSERSQARNSHFVTHSLVPIVLSFAIVKGKKRGFGHSPAAAFLSFFFLPQSRHFGLQQQKDQTCKRWGCQFDIQGPRSLRSLLTVLSFISQQYVTISLCQCVSVSGCCGRATTQSSVFSTLGYIHSSLRSWK